MAIEKKHNAMLTPLVIGLMLAALNTCVAESNAGAESVKKPIPEQRFEVIETGLEPMLNLTLNSDYGPSGIWLSDDLLMVNAIQDVPDADQKKLQRVMLVNASTGHSTTLVPEGRVVCWSEELEIVSIAPLIYNRQGIGRLMRLDKQGRLSELPEIPAVDPHICRSEKAKAPSSIARLLRESDGYIDRVRKVTAGGVNDIDKAILRKPGAPPQELPVRASEISKVMYLAYAKKYLLNTWDSQNDSDTDKRLGGANWNRPYDLTPYRLMALDGSIEEIPYPKVIFDYGIRYFDVLFPTRAGIVIEAMGAKRSEYGFFLLQGDRLTRFLGGPRILGFDGREGVNGISLSPDGCKIAFRLYSDWRPIKKQITIINLCKVN